MTMFFTIMALSIVITATIWDFRERRIPNWLTLPAIPLGVLCQTLMFGWAGTQSSLLGFAIGFGLFFLLFATGGSGGGDVKLMGGLGTWLGAQTIISVIVMSAVVVLFLLIVSLLRRITDPSRKKEPHTVAFAPPVCVALLLILVAKM
ncbi:A24 family peptidase [Thalassoglobus neptunius]|nr:A24 family peptidase [Thalassoglobus neptunius]